jgi:hypothetical protein
MSTMRLLQYVHCAVAHDQDTATAITLTVTDWVLFGDAAGRKALGLRAFRGIPATVKGRASLAAAISKALTECRSKRLVLRMDEIIEDEPMDEGKYGMRVRFVPAPRLWRQGARGPEQVTFVPRWHRYVDAEGVVASWDGLFATEGQVAKRSGR